MRPTRPAKAATSASEYDLGRATRESHDAAIQLTKGAEKWCDDMLTLSDQIEQELRIDCRVCRVLEGGQEIELVRTDGDLPAEAN